MAAVLENVVLADCGEPSRDEVWASIARCYAAFGSPLVPSREDIGLYEDAVAHHATSIQTGRIDAVMLGVTPGVALMNWPPTTRITAVDSSPHVIAALWPGDIPNVRSATCANWLAIPQEHRSCDVVTGDGSMNACRFPAEARALCRSVGRILKDGGIFVIRSYVQAPSRETVDAVFDELLSSKGIGVDSFKMRLWLAMQRSVAEGVAVRQAARVLDRYGVDSRVMRERLRWSSAAIEPFTLWRTSTAVYSFPTLDELRDVFREGFDEVSVTYPRYELGHCCPMLVLRARAAR
jgi:hypothetical protein